MRQIERYDTNIKEAKAHLQQIRIQEKEQYDKLKNLIKETSKKSDLVLMHDSRLKVPKMNF